MLRAGVRATLVQAGCEVVAEADAWPLLLGAVQTAEPDVVLVDDTLAGDFAAGIRALVRQSPDVAVVVLADRHTDAGLISAVRAGARGYLVSDIDLHQLGAAVDAVVAGEAVVPRRYVGLLLEQVRRVVASPRRDRDGPRLTDREQQVLDLLRGGWSTARIAQELYITPVTVRTHVAAIVHKMHVPDRRALLEKLDAGGAGLD